MTATITPLEASLLASFRQMTEDRRQWITGYSQWIVGNEQAEKARARQPPKLRLVTGGRRKAA